MCVCVCVCVCIYILLFNRKKGVSCNKSLKPLVRVALRCCNFKKQSCNKLQQITSDSG